MTFRERYNQEKVWHQKIILIELFHITMKARQPWGFRQTAKYFDISLGLVSENMRLAAAIHKDESLMNCPDRKTAAEKIGLKTGTRNDR